MLRQKPHEAGLYHCKYYTWFQVLYSVVYSTEFLAHRPILCTLHCIPGGTKKRPEICVNITARVSYKDKFPFAHL